MELEVICLFNNKILLLYNFKTNLKTTIESHFIFERDYSLF